MASAGVGAEGAGAAEPAPPHPAAPAAAEAAPASSGEDAGGPASSPPDAAAAAGQPIDYSALYEQVKGRPCHVERLGQRQEGFNGGRFRTKPDVIERELAPIQRATTLEEVHAALDTAGRNLAQLGAFSAINFLVLEEPEVRMGTQPLTCGPAGSAGTGGGGGGGGGVGGVGGVGARGARGLRRRSPFLHGQGGSWICAVRHLGHAWAQHGRWSVGAMAAFAPRLISTGGAHETHTSRQAWGHGGRAVAGISRLHGSTPYCLL